MKSILRAILSFINLFLIIIIILNILNLLSSKALKQTYPDFLGYTYYIPSKSDTYLHINKDAFLLIDTGKYAEDNTIVAYRDKKDKMTIGKLSINENIITAKNQTKESEIARTEIIGTVIANVPNLGNIINIILKPMSLLITVVILTITTITQSLLGPKRNKNTSKPNFNQTW